MENLPDYLLRKKAGRNLSFVLALLFCLVLGACFQSGSQDVIDFSAIETLPRKATSFQGFDDVLRLAVAPVYSPQTTLDLYRALEGYLEDQLHRQVRLVLGKTYSEINDLIRTGETPVAIVCTNAYLEGQEEFGLEALVVPQINSEVVYYSYLIVPADSPARSLTDLRDKSFAFSDPLSNSGRLVPVYYLQQVGETPDSFFGRTIFTYSHDNSVRAVMGKLVDGAAVDSIVYDFMVERDSTVQAKTRILIRWGPYGINPVVVHPRLDRVLKEQLRTVFLTMHQNTEGQAILAALGVDRFLPPNTTSYDSVRMMRDHVGRQP